MHDCDMGFAQDPQGGIALAQGLLAAGDAAEQLRRNVAEEQQLHNSFLLAVRAQLDPLQSAIAIVHVRSANFLSQPVLYKFIPAILYAYLGRLRSLFLPKPQRKRWWFGKRACAVPGSCLAPMQGLVSLLLNIHSSS